MVRDISEVVQVTFDNLTEGDSIIDIDGSLTFIKQEGDTYADHKQEDMDSVGESQ